MASLWGDGWFYISALGFLGSGALFLYLLGQYRSAVEDADEGDGSAALPASIVIEPLLPRPVVTELTPAPIAPQPKAKAAPFLALPVAAPQQPAPASTVATPGYTGPERRRSELTSSGGLSPAVVYLQNIKSQMERFDKEIVALKTLSAQQAAQGELVLKRLAELSEGLKTGAPLRSPLPAPTRSVELSLEPTHEAAPAAAPVALQPAVAKPSPVLSVESQPVAVPVEEPAAKFDPAATVVIEALPQEPAPAPAPAPVPAAQEQPAQPFPPRKGPVWPV